MFTSLAVALLSAPALQATESTLEPTLEPTLERVLDACSQDAAAMIALGNTKALLASDDPGEMLRAVMAPAFLSGMRRFLGSIDGLQKGAADEALGLMRKMEGAVVAFRAGSGQGMVCVAWGDEDLEASIRKTFEGFGAPLEAASVGGRDVGLSMLPSGLGFALIAEGNFVFIAHGLEGTLAPALDAYIPLLTESGAAGSEPAPSPGWWRSANERLDQPLLEGFLRTDAFADRSPEAQKATSLIPGGYMGMAERLTGSDASLIVVEFSDHKALGALADSVGQVPADLLSLPPASAAQATFFSLDPEAFIDAAAGVAAVFDDAAPEVVDSGFEMASGVLGLDVKGELLPALTGSFAFLGFPEESAAADLATIDEDESIDVAPLEGDLFPTIVVGIQDGEPFVDLLESLPGLIDTSEEEGVERWEYSVAGLGDILVSMTEESLIIAPPKRTRTMEARLALAPAERLASSMLDDASLEIAEERATGFGFGIQSTAGMMEAAQLMLDGLSAQTGGDEGAEGLLAAMNAFVQSFSDEFPERTFIEFSLTRAGFRMSSVMR